MKATISAIFFLLSFIMLNAQNVGIGTTSPAEKLDVNGNTRFSGYIRAQSVSLQENTLFIPSPAAILDIVSNNKGILIPRMSRIQRDAISFPDPGLLIYMTDPGNNGFYYNNGTAISPRWVKVGKENNDKGFLRYPNILLGTSFTVPPGISSIEFEAVSSGGGGGGGQIFNASFCGFGGGGGGGAAYSGLLKVNPGDVLSIEIGDPGTGGTTNTTPTPGTAGGDAGNTLIKVNGVLALELGGGKGAAGGVCTGSDFHFNVPGGTNGLVLFQNTSYIVPYHGNGGYPGGAGSSASVNALNLVPGGGFTAIIGQFNFLNTSKEPSYGHGGIGGTNNFNGGAGAAGYITLKY